MAKVVASSRLDMLGLIEGGFLQSLFANGTVTKTGANQFVVEYSDGLDFQEQLVLDGTFGGYDADGYPTTGTITGVTYSVSGSVLFTISDFSITVEEFTAFIDADDAEGLFAEILDDVDLLQGSNMNDVLMGFDGDDQLIGSGGHDTLNGGHGADVMAGGTGVDTYYVDNADDRVIEDVEPINDLVYSTVSFALPANVEFLLLTGSANINGYGNDLNNGISGNIGNNLLNGGGGADTMAGRLGDDTYIVDNSRDDIIEEANEGLDIVESSANYYVLSANVEILVLTGTAAIDGYGDDMANRIYGNNADNLLDGGAGIDVLRGNGGDDTYIVDNAADRVFEKAGGGFDTVKSSVSTSLKSKVERLVLTGPDNINGYGNDLLNYISGNSGDNILDGKGGADAMQGGSGNDTYFVNHIGDQIIEFANQGIDTVKSSVTYTLSANVEVLALEGLAAINGAGNSGANRLFGNSADNDLYGLGGNDKLFGGAGNDQLYGGDGFDQLDGGAGTDNFYFDTALHAGNVDVIEGFVSADDSIYLDDAVFSAIGAGTLAAGAFVTGTSALDADDRIIYDSATGYLYYDADGSGAGDQVLFAALLPGTSVTSADFIAY